MLRVILCIACVAVLATVGAAKSGPNGSWDGPWDGQAEAVDLPNDNLWYYCAANDTTIGPDGLGGWMYIPAQADLWQVVGPGCFSITDAWITGDQFEVYMDGDLILTTPFVPDWTEPEILPDVPGAPVPFADQAALLDAFHAPNYSHGFVGIPTGVHTINVKVIQFPDFVTGAGFGVRYSGTCAPVDNTSWTEIKSMFR